jgi:hypothetical protein
MADEPVIPEWWQQYTAEFPGWEVWRAANGLLYARRRGAGSAQIVRGEDPVDLRDEIIRAESKEQGLPGPQSLAASRRLASTQRSSRRAAAPDSTASLARAHPSASAGMTWSPLTIPS